MKKYMKNWGALLFRYAIGIGILIWLFRTNQINIDALSMINQQTAFFALSLCILQLVLSAWRVKLLLAAHSISSSLVNCILYNAVGVFYSTLLPGGMSGDAVRAYYFWRCDHTRDATKSALIGALITDRLIGTLAMLFVGLVAATGSAKTIGLSSQFLGLFWGAFILGVGGYLLVCGTHQYEWKVLDQSRFKLFFDRLRRVLSKLDLRDYPNRVLWASATISVMIHVASVLVIYSIATRLGSGLSFGQIMAIAPVGLLVNAIPVSPGGLGVGETGFDFLFTFAGGQYGGNVFMLSRLFLFSPAILGALFGCVSLIGIGRRQYNVDDLRIKSS